jgi:hypothetical protein
MPSFSFTNFVRVGDRSDFAIDGICEKQKIVVQAGVVYGCINAIKHCAPFRFSEKSVIAV